EHFSGSLVKVAAMMAAFRLRKQANDLARDRNAQRTPFVGGDFISALAATINWQDVVSKIKNASGLLPPRFDLVLSVTGRPEDGNLKVDFRAEFVDLMEEMIIPSDNCSAA